ncbi:GATOR complex protein MIOS [Hondaea fermentalgiana]|uniref:GATOR complex protein MIOS n=1 Tax=Hondaea fermentalgiana TaxID=2315210 RepID=A0A2R5GER7_9STRA|nr:GATOR complex protein MIOS [Hondaea fermentalgiana]|eukprot:GBG27113.1 GATOR complex protein MIOS [Hondaea fermentalgiana]
MQTGYMEARGGGVPRRSGRSSGAGIGGGGGGKIKPSTPVMEWSPHDSSHFVVTQSLDLKLYESVPADSSGQPESAVVQKHQQQFLIQQHMQQQQQQQQSQQPQQQLRGHARRVSAGSVVSGQIASWNAPGSSANAPVQSQANVNTSGAESAVRWKLKHSFVAMRTMARPIRCLSWYPGPFDPLLIATGDSSGTVRLVSLQDGVNTEGSGVVYEISPGAVQNRHCNALSWQPSKPGNLAVAVEKTRSEKSFALYDTLQVARELASAPEENKIVYSHLKGRSRPPPNLRPIFQSCCGEPTYSLAWAPDKESCIAVGAGLGWLRLYDVRDAESQKPPAVVAHTKIVSGIAFDPCRPDRLATFSEIDPFVKAWDLRRLDEPIAIIHAVSRDIMQIAWSPVRSGLLACATADERFISLYDVDKAVDSSDSGSDSSFENHNDDLPPPPPPPPAAARGSDDLSAAAALEDKESILSAKKRETDTKEDELSTKEITRSDVRRYTSDRIASFCWIPVKGAHPNSTGGPRNSVAGVPGASEAVGPNVPLGNAGPLATSVASRTGPGVANGSADPSNALDKRRFALSANRILFVSSKNGTPDDLSLQNPLPISVSPQSMLSFGGAIVPSQLPFPQRDPSLILRTRARLGYAIDADANTKLLERTIAAAKRLSNGAPQSPKGFDEEFYTMVDPSDPTSCLADLVRLRDMWRWVERASRRMDPTRAKGLVDAGLISILANRAGAQDGTRVDTTSKPRFSLYLSNSRNTALRLCGWRDLEEKEGHSGSMSVSTDTRFGVVGNDRDYQRLAALAIFDCNLTSAVQILQKAATDLRHRRRAHRASSNGPISLGAGNPCFEVHRDPFRSTDEELIADLLELVAMALAGYPGAESGNSSLWVDRCSGLLTRLDSFPVLRAALAFLVENYEQRVQHRRDLSRIEALDNSSLSANDSSGTRLDDGFSVSSAVTSIMPSGQISTTSSSGLAGIPEDEAEAEAGASVEHALASPTKSSGKLSIGSGASNNASISDLNTAASNKSHANGSDDVGSSGMQDVFLPSSEIEFSCVLKESRIALTDRIAFACRFLPDQKLYTFLRENCDHAIEHGHLDGIVLTGLGDRGMQLLQAYVDHSGDVQTAALVSCHTIPDELSVRDATRIAWWISSYRDLLNVWQLWQERARFDVRFAARERKLKAHREKDEAPATPSSPPPSTRALDEARHVDHVSSNGPSRVPEDMAGDALASMRSRAAQDPQVYAVCTHCKKSLLLHEVIPDASMLSGSSRLNDRKLTIPCCPHCKKRLSSCAVCVLPMSCINPYAQMMGTTHRERERFARIMEKHPRDAASHGRGRHKSASKKGEGKGGASVSNDFVPAGTAQPFGRWFSWCLRCRHGGHASCMTEWFLEHVCCPVSDCTCTCTSLR